MDNNITLYQIADAEIRKCIDAYLKLTRETHGLSIVEEQHLTDQRLIVILLAGIGIRQFNVTAAQAIEEWKRRSAIPL